MPTYLRAVRPDGPSLALDLYIRDALLNPVETFRRIGDAGAAVWLPKHRMWAIGRYQDVREAPRDDETFRSGKGVAANRLTNTLSRATTLTSDGSTHANQASAVAIALGQGAGGRQSSLGAGGFGGGQEDR